MPKSAEIINDDDLNILGKEIALLDNILIFLKMLQRDKTAKEEEV